MQNVVRQTKQETKRGIMQNEKMYSLDHRLIPLEEYMQEENPTYYTDTSHSKSGKSLPRVRALQLMKLLFLKCEP